MASTTELKVQSGRDARAAYRSTKYPFGRLRLEGYRTRDRQIKIRKRLTIPVISDLVKFMHREAKAVSEAACCYIDRE